MAKVGDEIQSKEISVSTIHSSFHCLLKWYYGTVAILLLLSPILAFVCTVIVVGLYLCKNRISFLMFLQPQKESVVQTKVFHATKEVRTKLVFLINADTEEHKTESELMDLHVFFICLSLVAQLFFFALYGVYRFSSLVNACYITLTLVYVIVLVLMVANTIRSYFVTAKPSLAMDVMMCLEREFEAHPVEFTDIECVLTKDYYSHQYYTYLKNKGYGQNAYCVVIESISDTPVILRALNGTKTCRSLNDTLIDSFESEKMSFMLKSGYSPAVECLHSKFSTSVITSSPKDPRPKDEMAQCEAVSRVLRRLAVQVDSLGLNN